MPKSRILLSAFLVCIWLVWALFVIAAERLGFANYVDASRIALAVLEGLLAVAATIVMMNEGRKDTRFLFLNFGLFFGIAGFVPPIYYNLIYESAMSITPYSNIFYYQYSEIAYFFLLTLCVVHLIVCITLDSGPYQKYAVALLIACGIALLCFFPFLEDPHYSDTTPEAVDYRAIRQAVNRLPSGMSASGLLWAVQSSVTLYDHGSGRQKTELIGHSKQKRIEELLPLVLKKEFTAIYWRELHMRCAYAALACTALLLVFAFYSFLLGFPAGAYLEKISWILLAYCVLEIFHLYSYALVATIGEYETISAIGSYLTEFFLVWLLLLFLLRWKFVRTIEGRYYEHTLATNSSKITRWRDAFDEWILRRYLNAEGLRRRFLLRRSSVESDDNSESP